MFMPVVPISIEIITWTYLKYFTPRLVLDDPLLRESPNCISYIAISPLSPQLYVNSTRN